MFLLRFILALALLMPSLSQLKAQRNYTDHKPVYRPWTQNYIIDRIDYQSDRTIIHFRSICQHAQYNRATFYPPQGKYAWFLTDKNTGQHYEMLAIKNLRRNDVLMHQEIKKEETILADMTTGKTYTIFSCEIHFPNLSNKTTLVDLIEGRGGENKKNHYNCFDIQVKPIDDKDLGKEEDSKENIEAFEARFNPEKRRELEEKKNNPETKEKTGVLNALPRDQDPPTPPKPLRQAKEQNFGPAQALREPSCNNQFILTEVRFRDNSPEFFSLVRARESLDMLYHFMLKNPDAQLVLEGHTDIFGDAERNKRLSYERVLNVQKYICGMGLAPNRVEIAWFGSEKPLHPQGHAENRRVEAKIYCPASH